MIEEVFGVAGLLAQKFPGYAPRKGQLDMAAAVASAFDRKRHLVVEGPTGTGKSLAYLAPAIYQTKPAPGAKPGWVPASGRVIVVTANIALQEQLVQKDLPLLADVLQIPFRFALAKGKNNYLCLDSLSKFLGEGLLGQGDQMMQDVVQWAQSTTTGDVSEFPGAIPPALWRKFSTTSDECKGSACKAYAHCFAEKAKAGMAAANVVVTNYHLFFAHLLVRTKMNEIRARGGEVDPDVVLPPADYVVFDEAHEAADIARDFLGFQLSKGQVERLVRGFNHDLAPRTKLACERFFQELDEHRKSRAYKSRLKLGHPLQPCGEEFAALLDRVAKFYKDSASAASWDPDEKAELELRARRGASLAAQVRQAMRPEATPDVVYFAEEVDRGGVVLKSKPIDVAPWIQENLFKQYKAVILTSATLATSGGFGFVRKEIGLDKLPADELQAESPFRFEDNVMLIIPKTMCDPTDFARFPAAVADHVRETCIAAGGRTLGLFTSYKTLEAAHRACARLPFRVFRQGEAPRTRLAKQFRDDVSSCLLGTNSFWQGVDCPGETLSCVVIDRLPFPTPDDPIVDAISDRDDKWFYNYAIPRAIIKMKQGFGRLIRTTTDRGCVVILDRRLQTKGYGRAFINALPRVRMGDEIQDVARFLAASE